MKILLATDGSDSARAATDFLTRFPFPHDKSATVITVIETNIFNEDTLEDINEKQGKALRKTRQTAREEGEQLLASETARLRDAGWTGSGELRSGDPAEEIIQTAGELKPDLIVLGSHGIKGIKDFLLGSVSDKVLEHACCSVLIVKASPKLHMQPGSGEADRPWRILLAYDDSEPARKAATFCASLPLDENAEVMAVSVMPMVHMYRQDIRQQLNPIWQQHKLASETALKNAIDTLRQSIPNVSSAFRESPDVSEEILDIASRSESDLVVLGYKGRSAIKRFLLGSVTSRIAHHAPCSVLVVRN